ncbi:MAG TPA: DUF418 domain-containing protein [Steroidobacteraceae bacterium]|nr:DUF418 domain-containing protein [Steroidobacteraceae bacterium]
MQTESTLHDPGGRIAVVDVLRAYSLFGIIVTHSVNGFLAGRPPDREFMLFSSFDRVVAQLEQLLTFGKFFTIFSFLFGLSFAIQLRNATQKGVGFSGRFTWRLLVLALIALVHSAFFTGDILIIYAFLGLLLIPFRNLKTRTLLIVSLLLVFNVPGLLLGIAQINAPPPTPEQLAARAEFAARFLEAAQRQFEIKQSGTFAELAHINFTSAMLGKLAFMVFTGRLWITFGLFLLGMCAGRLEIFRDTETNRRFFHRLLWPAAAVALVTTIVEIVHPSTFQPKSIVDLLASFSFTVQQVSLSAFYVAAVTLLYWRQPSQGLLPALAPLGRMGLTTYLGQTAFGVVLFYGLGFGMLGKIGVAAAAGAAIAFYILQVFIARAWMTKFTMGPVEWLWRSLTYFRLQPNRRGEAQAA